MSPALSQTLLSKEGEDKQDALIGLTLIGRKSQKKDCTTGLQKVSQRCGDLEIFHITVQSLLWINRSQKGQIYVPVQC